MKEFPDRVCRNNGRVGRVEGSDSAISHENRGKRKKVEVYQGKDKRKPLQMDTIGCMLVKHRDADQQREKKENFRGQKMTFCAAGKIAAGIGGEARGLGWAVGRGSLPPAEC